MNKNTLLIFLAASIAMIGGLAFHGLPSNENARPNIPVAEFSLPDVSGVLHDSSEWQGKIRIINFWATWCAPCLKEIPEFIKLQDKLGSQNVQFIGIAIDSQQAVKGYLDTIDPNYPMLIGGDSATALSYKMGNILKAVPFTVFVNAQGNIIHRQPGEVEPDQIIEIVRPLLKINRSPNYFEGK
jgi:thiol-disulfide isomerase/thioredoxin